MTKIITQLQVKRVNLNKMPKPCMRWSTDLKNKVAEIIKGGGEKARHNI